MSRLPDFIIIGASRSGTSSLFRSLLQHPDLSGPPSGNKKEVHFFDKKYDRGLQWYRAQFRGKKMNCEATPNYLYDKKCPALIAKDLPDCKFIVMLRNPVDRAFSHYRNWKKKHGWTEKTIKNPNHEVINKGVYIIQLKRWHYYIPKERIMIIRSEDFYGNPEKIINDIYAWIGLRPIENLKSIYFDPKNQDANKPNKKNQVMPNNIRVWLRQYYRKYNNQLYEYLGRDMGWQ